MTITKTEEGLQRVVGVSGLAFTIVSFTIGAGIFALPGIVGAALGPFAVFGYIFCGIMLAAIMLCYAEIGSKVTTAGGSYAYVEAAFGTFPAFLINWIFIFGWSILGDAALLNIISDSLSVIFPVFANAWAKAALIFVLISFITIVNIMGVNKAIVVVKLITILKLIPLIAIVVFGFSRIQSGNLHWEHLPSINTFGNTALVLFFAFSGFESALGVSGEIRNPQRTVPLGILLGGIVIFTVYMLLQSVTLAVLGADMELYKAAPLAAVAEKIVGPIGGTILLLTAAVSCFGAIMGDVLNTPRMVFAGARDGIFPAFLRKVHPKYATPYWAIAVFTVFIFLISLSGGFQQLAVLASAAILLIYLAVILATIKLRRNKQTPVAKTFRAPGGLLFPGIAMASIMWLLTSLSKWEILSIIIFIAVVSVIYLLMQQFKVNKVLGQPHSKKG